MLTFSGIGCTQGFVVGFKGGQVFCLHYNSMQAVEVPQSTFMQGYLAAEDWNNAYKVRHAIEAVVWVKLFSIDSSVFA